MERFVRFTAPTGKLDFILRLGVFLLICGFLNHMRDFIQHPAGERNTFLGNFTDASFTALPMCTFALILIAHLNNLQRRLYVLATTDALTRLRNRRWFMERAADATAGNAALIMLDIDHFKDVNDTYGHDAGDHCLCVVAQHIEECLRPEDACGRLGGEEFAVLLHKPDQATLHKIATDLCSGVLFNTTKSPPKRVTLSAGIAIMREHQALADALRVADSALYRAKENGRGRYEMGAGRARVDPNTAMQSTLRRGVVPA